jgi:type VI protein secretion system component VasF
MDLSAIGTFPVADVIQLALTPVFLLSGVGIILTVLTNRLARVVDRARSIEASARSAAPGELPAVKEELRVQARRARLINRAITLSTISALLVALVVAMLFVSAMLEMNFSAVIATMFILAMLSLIVGLVMFLREVFLAISTLRIGLQQ